MYLYCKCVERVVKWPKCITESSVSSVSRRQQARRAARRARPQSSARRRSLRADRPTRDRNTRQAAAQRRSNAQRTRRPAERRTVRTVTVNDLIQIHSRYLFFSESSSSFPLIENMNRHGSLLLSNTIYEYYLYIVLYSFANQLPGVDQVLSLDFHFSYSIDYYSINIIL